MIALFGRDLQSNWFGIQQMFRFISLEMENYVN